MVSDVCTVKFLRIQHEMCFLCYMITHTARAVSCAPINRKPAPAPVLPVIET